MREVLNLGYTSSDESLYEYDSDPEHRVRASYKTRPTKIKTCLDAVYEKGLTRRVQQSHVTQEMHENTVTDFPEHFVEWAVRRSSRLLSKCASAGSNGLGLSKFSIFINFACHF